MLCPLQGSRGQGCPSQHNPWASSETHLVCFPPFRPRVCFPTMRGAKWGPVRGSHIKASTGAGCTSEAGLGELNESPMGRTDTQLQAVGSSRKVLRCPLVQEELLHAQS